MLSSHNHAVIRTFCSRALAHDFGVVESVGLQEVLWFAVGVDQNPKRDTHGI